MFKLIKIFITIVVLSISIEGFATTNDHLTPQNFSQVSEITLQGNLDTQGYSLKRIQYVAKNGRIINKDLYYIVSEAGAQLAYQQAGLSYTAYQEAILDFQQPILFSQRTSTTSSMVTSSDPSSGMLLIIDKEVEQLQNQTQADAYIANWGLELDAGNDVNFDALTLSSEYGSSCPGSWKCRTRTYEKNGFNKAINRTEQLIPNSGSNSVTFTIVGSAKIDATAKLDYRYKRKFKIPYKVKVDFLDAKLQYDFLGSFNVQGQTSVSFAGKEVELFQNKIYDNIFMVGPIPVQVDVKTYVRAGTGNLNLTASGEIGMHKPLNIKGSFSYVCDSRNCNKQSENFNNLNDGLDLGNVAYEVVAKAELEPYLNAALRGRLYWGSIYAEVGLQPSIPFKLYGYIGNMCGDGDGLNGNETVRAGLLDADFRAGVTWKTKFLFNSSDRKYKEFYRTDLFYMDFLNPSTALSPIIRTNISTTVRPGRIYDYNVTVNTSLRSCIASELDRRFQNFNIDWGNGQNTVLSNVESTAVSTFKYSAAGEYIIKVRHENGAFTQRIISLVEPSDGSGGDSGEIINPPGGCPIGEQCIPGDPTPTNPGF